ncbi:MAG: peptidoglycan-binding protein [Chromatiales bacterium]|nr:peptidoglycan-binding protein [Chromatiales bacterium]
MLAADLRRILLRFGQTALVAGTVFLSACQTMEKAERAIDDLMNRPGGSTNAYVDPLLGSKNPLPDRSSQMQELQELLNSAGFNAGIPDGIKGQRTEMAIRSYQGSRNMAVDGQATEGLLALLRETNGRVNRRNTDYGRFFSAEDAQPIANGSAQMKLLQSELNRAGKSGRYSAGKPDGYYGEKTRQAILAYQRQNGLAQDGKATEGLLKHMQSGGKTASNGSGGNFFDAVLGELGWREDVPLAVRKQESKEEGRCFDFSNSSGLQQKMSQMAFDRAVEELPFDIKPYLAGFCVPDSEAELRKAYLYLITQGTLHARVTITKYNELLAIYQRAGEALAVEADLIRRSANSLDKDLKLLSQDRMKGLESLIDHFYDADDSVRTLLSAASEKYDRLKGDYREQARRVMGEALAHSSSATFFLSRSLYAGKKLLATISPEDLGNAQNSAIQNFVGRLRAFLANSTDLVYFVFDKREDMGSMLLASSYSVQVFTHDIVDIERIDRSEALREVADLKRKSGIKAGDDFERQFEDEQERQLKDSGVA